MKNSPYRQARNAGLTLLELVTVIVIIAILATMLLPVVSSMAARMDRAKCTMNLKALYVGAESYLQDQKRWPQIDPQLVGETDSDEYARQWMAALSPYKISKESWHCPTVQKKLSAGAGTSSSESSEERIDYLPTPFDDKEITPHRWSGQPWFIERGSVHADGNLMIFPDGSVKTLYEYLPDTRPSAQP
ncbi:MAG: type II secretion system GspH family protein [Chthoniobacter sp.]|nr:type II secretion system GspH family protein [Chthoniobacter sp.]